MTVMKSDSSLKVVEQAGRYFTRGTEQKIKPLAISYLYEWWQVHREEFKKQEVKEPQQPAASDGEGAAEEPSR